MLFYLLALDRFGEEINTYGLLDAGTMNYMPDGYTPVP